ncbi:MAG TPA: rhomboid family intramembrane serine protease [Pseudomonadales bacterium]|nr:rhomboid family intramembrane serine protease [Pseudomonadales bacterium]
MNERRRRRPGLPPGITTEPAADVTHDGAWLRLRAAPLRPPIAEASFVLTAVQIDNRINETIDGFELWVRADAVAAAERELGGYQREAATDGPPPPAPPSIDTGALGILAYLLVIWAVPFLQGQAPFGDRMLDVGRMQAGLILAGEWWRTFTALTLHADSGHIIANSAFGALFGIYVGRGLGSGVGWLLVLLAGAGGNALNAYMQASAFSSIGASTATFGALGLFAGVTWGRGEMRRGMGWRRNLAPLFAGFALVVWTGTGGENTDVAAHFTGFGCGAALGIAAARIPRPWLGLPAQIAAGAAGLALVAGAWRLALW